MDATREGGSTPDSERVCALLSLDIAQCADDTSAESGRSMSSCPQGNQYPADFESLRLLHHGGGRAPCRAHHHEYRGSTEQAPPHHLGLVTG